MIYRSPSRPAARRGIILLVVLALLTLFAIAGLAFVFYAQSRADSARVYREAQLKSLASGPDTPPEVLFDDWIRQFIFDVGDNQNPPGTPNKNFWNSAMRGHSLARSMYGGPVSGAYIDGPGWAAAPYSGTGRLHSTPSSLSVGGDDYGLINYTLYTGDTRDPEVFSSGRANFSTSYTYPDMNNMFLAAVRADGTVISPSFHRNWGSFGSLAPSNGNWGAAGAARYQVLRPRTAENPLFPPTVTGTSGNSGDIANLGGDPDSIWMDIGSPVKALADGTLYKPLYAALVVDLDGRINLNTAGNIRGSGGAQASNSGIGPWEMNLKDVLYVDATEWPNMFKGNGTTMGRYGANSQPDVSVAGNQLVNLTPTGNGQVGRYSYNFYDYDGVDESSGAASGTLVLPSTIGVAFPSKPTGYGNGSGETGPAAGNELFNHPQTYNIFSPGGDDRVFSVAQMKGLLYVGPTGGTFSTSTLGKLAPNTLGANNTTAARARRLVTTISFDLDVPGITPWQADTTYNYTMTAPAFFPSGAAQNFPAVGIVTGGGAEFNPGGQAAEVAASPKLGRIDVNRKLTDYPPIQGDGRFLATDMAASMQYPAGQFQQAQLDRQTLAADIYVRLVQVTGAFNQFTNSGSPNQPQVDALRYLAQLAVNMVDYIDVDDYMTPFNWVAAAPTGQTTLASFATTVVPMDPIGKGWVFGTEIPKLVLNEAYAEIDNDTGDLTGVNNFYLNFYAELYNPFIQDAAQTNSAAAMLQMGTGTTNSSYTNPWAVHQIVITNTNNKMRDLNNAFGNPDGTTLLTVADYTADPNAPPVAPGVVGAAGSYGGAGSLAVTAAPAGGPYNGTITKNTIMCVIGPGSQVRSAIPPADTGPGITSTIPVKLQTSATTVFSDPYNTTPATTYQSGMSYKLTRAQYEGAASPCRSNPGSYGMLLRRLACPNLPPQLDSTKANYNPYITVDYVDTITAYDGATKDNLLPNVPAKALALRSSTAKKQPYASEAAQWSAETAPAPAQPMSTFFSQNTAAVPATWLTHLDRPVTSPMELLQVSGFKPHELTQQFINPTRVVDAAEGNNFQHRAPWNNVSTRLYRVFEFLETKSRLPGVQVGGRIPGKVNINTIWDPEVFRALCDPQSSNAGGGFTASADADAVYNAMVAKRTPNLGAATPALSAADQPFMGMATGNTPAADTQYPSGTGLQNTLFAQSGGKYLFEGPSTTATQHPYLRAMLLNKIYNNVTTRSNVFGVWLTVGFFQVTNVNTTPPPTLTTEWGISSGINIRHHMFAVVDRSSLGVSATTALGNGQAAISTYGLQTVTLSAAPTTPLTPGMVLSIDTAPNQESVVIRTVTSPTSFTAVFGKTHTAGFPIYQVISGNPGPQPMFSAKDSTALVPYYTIID